MSSEAVERIKKAQKDREKQKAEQFREKRERFIELAEEAKKLLDNPVVNQYFLDFYAIFLEWVFQSTERDNETLVMMAREVRAVRHEEEAIRKAYWAGRQIIERHRALEEEREAISRDRVEPPSILRRPSFVDHLIAQTGDGSMLDRAEELRKEEAS